MGTEGLTPRQLAILLTISENEGVSQTELVSRTGIDRSTLADVIRRMIKKSLIQRKRTRQDARAYAVKLTDVGRKALDDAEPVARRVDDQLMQMLPVAQRASFLTSLAALTELLNETAGRKDR